jgi:hypothetical protein
MNSFLPQSNVTTVREREVLRIFPSRFDVNTSHPLRSRKHFFVAHKSVQWRVRAFLWFNKSTPKPNGTQQLSVITCRLIFDALRPAGLSTPALEGRADGWHTRAAQQCCQNPMPYYRSNCNRQPRNTHTHIKPIKMTGIMNIYIYIYIYWSLLNRHGAVVRHTRIMVISHPKKKKKKKSYYIFII